MGGGLLGLPLIALVGTTWDVVLHHIERHPLPWFLMLPLISLLGAGGNLVVFAKRLLVPPGPSPTHFLGLSGIGFDIISYAMCGLVAGSAAIAIARSRSS